MSKKKISESKLIKALADLEGAVAKGDPLEDADPEGGLSTEGEPLSDDAPRGRGEPTRKSRRPADDDASSPVSKASSVSSDDEDDDDDEGGDDDSSEDAPPPPPKKIKKGGKTISKMAYSMSASESDNSSDDDDSERSEKSFRARAEGDEQMRKGMIVNDFLESLVDHISAALRDLSKSIKRSFDGLEDRLAAHIDDRVSKSTETQQAFNVRLAKATAAIGNTIQDDLVGMVDMVKSIANQPVSPRGKSVLSKGDVNQPPWSGPSATNADQRLANGADDYVEALSQLGTQAVSDWLFRKSTNQQIDPRVILAWEADRYDPAMLPAQVRKAIVDDLVK